jgi:hypothetical protein
MKHVLAKFIALIIGIYSCVVVSGWILKIDLLTRLLPYGINMKFPTAVAFFLSALSLYLIARSIERNDERGRILLLVISFFIFLIMTIFLVNGLTHRSVNLGNLFLQKNGSPDAFGAGAPSLASTVNFILFGIASMLSFFPDAGLYGRLRFFGSIILIISLVPILGYALDYPVLYYRFDANTVPMAFNTALTFILLSSGLIALSSHK